MNRLYSREKYIGLIKNIKKLTIDEKIKVAEEAKKTPDKKKK